MDFPDATRALIEIAEVLRQDNYSEADVRGILGENWLRGLLQRRNVDAIATKVGDGCGLSNLE